MIDSAHSIWHNGGTDRRALALTVLPHVLLAALGLVTIAFEYQRPATLLIDLGLCLCLAAWTMWLITLHPQWRDSPRMMALFMVGMLAVTAVLTVRDPWFGCFAPAAYVYAFRLLRWPILLPGIALVAIIAGTAQSYDIDKTSVGGLLAYVAVLVINVVPMCGFAWFGRVSAIRNDERVRALAQLREANRKLELTLSDNARLHQRLLVQARQTGVDEERQRMAREIHDTLAQGLIGIITQLQAVAPTEDEAGQRHLDAAVALARDSLSEARRSVHALRPQPLETGRLGEAIAEVADRWSRLHGVSVTVTTTGTVRTLAPDTEIALLRTAQEALANVAKHAQAHRVGVTLSFWDDQVALDVRDDGRGFDPAALPEDRGADPSLGGGFGLVAMRQRIEDLDGRLQLESEPGGGTAISACVPIERAEVDA